jgi:hypothetical protein
MTSSDNVCDNARPNARAHVRVSVGLAAVLSVAAGCATARIVTEKRGDQRYFLRCQTPLGVCLTEGAEAVCQGNHYVVERALNEVNERGTVTSPTVEHTSAALVHCGPAHVWNGIDTKVDGPASAPAPVTASPAAAATGQRVCTPGATQACVGPGGRQGGQACLTDGSAFGPCDCGPSVAPPTAVAPPPT